VRIGFPKHGGEHRKKANGERRPARVGGKEIIANHTMRPMKGGEDREEAVGFRVEGRINRQGAKRDLATIGRSGGVLAMKNGDSRDRFL